MFVSARVSIYLCVCVCLYVCMIVYNCMCVYYAAVFTLWLTAYERSGRDLNELDICLSAYDSAMRYAMWELLPVHMSLVNDIQWNPSIRAPHELRTLL